MPPTPQILDTLYVKVQAQAQEYFNTMQQVIKTNQKVVASLNAATASGADSFLKKTQVAATGAATALTNVANASTQVAKTTVNASTGINTIGTTAAKSTVLVNTLANSMTRLAKAVNTQLIQALPAAIRIPSFFTGNPEIIDRELRRNPAGGFLGRGKQEQRMRELLAERGFGAPIGGGGLPTRSTSLPIALGPNAGAMNIAWSAPPKAAESWAEVGKRVEFAKAKLNALNKEIKKESLENVTHYATTIGSGILKGVTQLGTGIAKTFGVIGQGIVGATRLITRFGNYTIETFTQARTKLLLFAGSILGLEVISLRAFTSFDKLLTKIQVHTRDFGGANRGAIQDALLSQSMASIHNADALASAYDQLASTGMNTAMSIQALAIADKFATAGFMDLDHATKGLIDVQTSLGLATKDAGEYLKNMTNLSDLFVGLAPQMHSTVEQLIEAFGPRFAAAVTSSNIPLREAVALQGAYSLAGIKGSEAADRASQFLVRIAKLNVQERMHWDQLLGPHSVFGINGQMLPLYRIVQNLEKAFGGLNIEMKAAKLELLGLEPRQIQAVLPLLGRSQDMKRFADEATRVAGITAKSAGVVDMSFFGQMKMMRNTLEALFIMIGQRLAPAIAWLNTQIRRLTEWFTNLDPRFQKIIVTMASVTGASLLLGYVLTTLINPATIVAGLLVFMSAKALGLTLEAGVFGEDWKEAFELFSTSARNAMVVVGYIFKQMLTVMKDLFIAFAKYIGDYLLIEFNIAFDRIKFNIKFNAFGIPVPREHTEEERRGYESDVESYRRTSRKAANDNLNKSLLDAAANTKDAVEAFSVMPKLLDPLKKKLSGSDPMAPIYNALVASGYGGALRGLYKPTFAGAGVSAANKGEDIFGDLSGRTGPGFQFKEISLSRYMLGGEVNKRLDYEQLQVLKQIAKGVDNLVIIGRGANPQGAAAGVGLGAGAAGMIFGQ